MMDVEAKTSTNEFEEVSVKSEQHVDDVPLDFIDPHRAALENNPEHAEKLSLSTILAVVVRDPDIVELLFSRRLTCCAVSGNVVRLPYLLRLFSCDWHNHSNRYGSWKHHQDYVAGGWMVHRVFRVLLNGWRIE